MLLHRRDPEGLRHTPYFGLEWHVHMQLLQSPLRVMDPAAADLIYVPFYVISLATTHALSHCSPELSREAKAERVAQFWAEAPAALPLLGSKPRRTGWCGLIRLPAGHAALLVCQLAISRHTLGCSLASQPCMHVKRSTGLAPGGRQ
jgi:hypothetical protein